MAGEIDTVEYYENSVVTKGGEERIIAWHNTLLKDDEGNFVGTLSSGDDITERKRAEEMLRESEERYRTIFKQAADSIVLIDPKTAELVEFNDKAFENLGYTHEEFAKLNISNLEAIESPEEVLKHARKVIKEGADSFETKKLTKNGEVRDFYVKANSVSFRGKDFIQSIWYDITKRKRAEKALKESESRAVALLKAIPDLMFRLNSQGVFLDYTAENSELYAQDEDTLIGKRNRDLTPPEFADLIDKKIRQTLDSEEMQTFEYQLPIPKRGPVDYEARMVKSGEDEVTAIVQDITERKHAEEMLRRSEERYRLLFDSAPDSVTIVDTEGLIVECSQSGVVLYGYSKQELIGRHLTELMHPSSTAVFREKFQKLQRLVSVEGEIRICKSDGSIVDIWRKGIPLTDADGNFAGVLVHDRDITERKLVQQVLESERAQLLSIFDSIDEIVYIADLNTYEILYVNKSIKDAFQKEIIGGICYKEFQGLDSPCEFCTNEIILKQKPAPHRWEYHNPILDRDYAIVDRIIKWSDGRDVRFEFATDITKRKQAEEEIMKAHDQLRGLSQKLEKVREEERTKLAGDIHDVLGQSVTALQIDLSILKQEVPKDDKVQQEKMDDMLELLSNLDDTLSQMYSELRPFMLDELGLLPAMDWYSREFEKRTGTKCKLQIQPEVIELDHERSTALYRIYQEILTNISRHAEASSVSIKLEEKAGKIMLTAKDDGRGITSEEMNAPDSLGIIGMKERVFPYDGELNIKGIKGKGTIVQVKLPFSNKGIES